MVWKPGTSKDKEVLVATVTEQISDEELANLPRVKNLFNQFWEEKMKELHKKDKNGDKNGKPSNFIKSPSDTTIYAPALMKSPENQNVLNCGSGGGDLPFNNVGKEIAATQNERVVNLISDFVDSVRLEQRQEAVDLQEKERRKSSSNQVNLEMEEARNRTDRAVLEAEKFRANIANPDPGMEYFHNIQSDTRSGDKFHKGVPVPKGGQQSGQAINAVSIPQIGEGVSDDDFFHLTCHIDPTLIHKIENGEFVELEKLIPKEKVYKNDENHLEWVQRDGGTFLVPAQCDSKISSFRRWNKPLELTLQFIVGQILIGPRKFGNI